MICNDERDQSQNSFLAQCGAKKGVDLRSAQKEGVILPNSSSR